MLPYHNISILPLPFELHVKETLLFAVVCMTTFLLTFLPLKFRGQYWFMDNNFSYFAMESSFLCNDFILLCQYYCFASAKEMIEETSNFLQRMDSKGVKWLIFVPDILYIRELFSAYRFYPLGSSQSGVRALVITNYRVRR